MGDVDKDQERYEWALQVLIEAGVVDRCPAHPECTFEGGEDIEEAYKAANADWSRGGGVALFADRRQMTDEIKAVYNDNSMLTECSQCERHRNE